MRECCEYLIIKRLQKSKQYLRLFVYPLYFPHSILPEDSGKHYIMKKTDILNGCQFILKELLVIMYGGA